jgi:hypothetical protein
MDNFVLANTYQIKKERAASVSKWRKQPSFNENEITRRPAPGGHAITRRALESQSIARGARLLK